MSVEVSKPINPRQLIQAVIFVRLAGFIISHALAIVYIAFNVSHRIKTVLDVLKKLATFIFSPYRFKQPCFFLVFVSRLNPISILPLHLEFIGKYYKICRLLKFKFFDQFFAENWDFPPTNANLWELRY